MHINFSDMNQRHLFLAYAITLTLQFGYAGWIAWNWLKLNRSRKSFPSHGLDS